MKTTAWTDEDRAEMARQRAHDYRGAYELGEDGKPLVVTWMSGIEDARRRVLENLPWWLR